MKVAMIDPSLFTGRYDDGLCAGLADAGADVTLYGRPMRATDAIEPLAYRYRPSFFRASERVRGLIGEGAGFRAIKGLEYLAGAWAGTLGDIAHANIAHFQWLPFPLADARLIARLAERNDRPALVHTVHNASAFHGDSGMQGRGYRDLLDWFDALIAHGEGTVRSLVEQGVQRDRIHIVPHPPMELASASAADFAAVPDPQRPRILFFGTIRPYKGFDLLAEACIELWREGLDFELAVAGKPFTDIGALLKWIAAAGFVDRLISDLGFLTEGRLDAHLQKSDIIVFPYRHIDSSGAFLSALHYGKAMVATRVGMFAGFTGEQIRLCDPGDAAALADALREVVKDRELRTRLGCDALAVRADMGHWNDAARTMIEVYEKVTKR
jgi:glycosyltransferase involved in cell wall biosynthesis